MECFRGGTYPDRSIHIWMLTVIIISAVYHIMLEYKLNNEYELKMKTLSFNLNLRVTFELGEQYRFCSTFYKGSPF